jgi:1A family penicillin-binding protein
MSLFKQYKSKYIKSWKEYQKREGSVLDLIKKQDFNRFSKKTSTKRSSVIITLIIVAITIGFAGLIVITLLFAWFAKDLPDPASLSYRVVPQSTKIYDRTGQILLYDVHGEEKRTAISLSEIPEFVKQATLIAEDREFFKHKGLNWKGIIRAAFIDLISRKKTQGGSSITQQLVKNAILSPEKTFTRKIKEFILAYRLESRFNKNEILEMYFNEIPYGSTLYGIEAAAQSFFGKHTKDLNLAEAALLTSLPKAPTYYSPYGNHKDELLKRINYIIDEMEKSGYISSKEAQEAKNYKVLEKVLPFKEKIIAPHFVMYVKELLIDKYGEKTLEQGGLKVITTLDVEKQKIAEEAITKFAEQNEKQYNATNAALVALDAKNGQILAMVGSRDFFEPTFGSVNVTLRPRQPGSSFKPIVYAAAFKKGYTPSTILYDVETVFKTLIEGEYIPKNYNGKTYGPITMKQALAGSLNIPAVKTLYLTGIDQALDLAEKLGYSTFKDRSRFGLSLVLGGGEVKLLEHANAFGTIIREGKHYPTAAILRVEDSKGNILEEWQDKSEKILDEEIFRNIIDILSDNNARAFIFGENNYLKLKNHPAMVKTGTTNDFRDAWTVGGTPSLVAGVWVGNNDNHEMKEKADGSMVAAPIWNYFMNKSLEGKEIEEFTKPLPITTGKPVLDGKTTFEYEVQIDKASGKLATQYTPKSYIETRKYKKIHSILYYVNKDDPRGPEPINPEEDPQFETWEEGVKKWAQENQIIPAEPPKEYDDLHIPSNFPNLEVLNISNGMNIMNRNLEIKTSASAPRGVKRIEISLDNQILNNSSYSNSVFVSIPSSFSEGSHILKIEVFDDIDNSTSKTFTINLSS